MLDSRNANSKVHDELTLHDGDQTEVGAANDTVSTIKGIYPGSSVTAYEGTAYTPHNLTWCYVHVHYKKTKGLEQDCAIFADAPVLCFVDRSTSSRVPKRLSQGKRVEHDTGSGLVFFQGEAADVQRYLNNHYPNPIHLVKDPATGMPAVIPNDQMIPFMQASRLGSSLVRIMDHPISYYAEGHKLMRILTGILKGREGYVVRKAGDRKFILPFGNKSLSISNIHKELFEEVVEQG